MIIPTLFRGDSLPPEMPATGTVHRGRTFAEYYYREGLMAKSADGARGTDLALPLARLVAAHIGSTKGTPEERQAKHSPLISFSTNLDRAQYFSDRTREKEFEVCGIEDATHFTWRLSLPVLQATVVVGTYKFSYTASTKNVDASREAQVDRVRAGDESSWLSATVTQAVHGHVQADPTVHTALVIDAVAFLGSLGEREVEPSLRKLAAERAAESSEWLLYPNDPMDDGPGYSARFTLNEHLHLHRWVREV